MYALLNSVRVVLQIIFIRVPTYAVLTFRYVRRNSKIDASRKWVYVCSTMYVCGRQSSWNTVTRSAAAWPPGRLCYRPVVFFRHLRCVAFSFQPGKHSALVSKMLFLLLLSPGRVCNSSIRAPDIRSVGAWKRSQATNYQPRSFGQFPFTSSYLTCIKRIHECTVGTRLVFSFDTTEQCRCVDVRRMNSVLCLRISCKPHFIWSLNRAWSYLQKVCGRSLKYLYTSSHNITFYRFYFRQFKGVVWGSLSGTVHTP
jgi:hypothetical protein